MSSFKLRRIDRQTRLFLRLSHILFILELLGISILTLVIMSEQNFPHPDLSVLRADAFSRLIGNTDTSNLYGYTPTKSVTIILLLLFATSSGEHRTKLPLPESCASQPRRSYFVFVSRITYFPIHPIPRLVRVAHRHSLWCGRSRRMVCPFQEQFRPHSQELLYYTVSAPLRCL